MNNKRGLSRIWVVIFGLWEVVTLGSVLLGLIEYFSDPWRESGVSTGLSNSNMQMVVTSACLAAVGVPVFLVGRWIGRGFDSDAV